MNKMNKIKAQGHMRNRDRKGSPKRGQHNIATVHVQGVTGAPGPQENRGLGNDAGIGQERNLNAGYKKLKPRWDLPLMECECG